MWKGELEAKAGRSLGGDMGLRTREGLACLSWRAPTTLTQILNICKVSASGKHVPYTWVVYTLLPANKRVLLQTYL